MKTRALDGKKICAGLFAISGAHELEVLNVDTKHLSGHRKTAVSGVDGKGSDFWPQDEDVKYRFPSVRFFQRIG